MAIDLLYSDRFYRKGWRDALHWARDNVHKYVLLGLCSQDDVFEAIRIEDIREALRVIEDTEGVPGKEA